MKPTTVPMPEPPTQPEEQPVPEVQPRRRTFIQPVFTGRFRRIRTKAASTFAVLLCISAVQAQTPRFPDPPPAPGVPSQPMHPDAPHEPRTAPQQPSQDGWVMFDDRVGKELGLEADVLKRLREVDDSYQKEYAALGNDPVKNPAYRSLSERRNADAKGILTPEQYDRWIDMKPHHAHGDGNMKTGSPSMP